MKKVALLLICSLLVGGCTLNNSQGSNTSNDTKDASTSTENTETRPLTEVLQANPEFSTLVELLQIAGLMDVLGGTDSFTVFAPTNQAFAAYDGLASLKERPELLNTVLLHHIALGKLSYQDLKVQLAIQAIDQDLLEISEVEDTTSVSGARIVNKDIAASNGVIHGIESVIIEE